MTYPEGNLIARNLVQRPKFDSTQKAEGWSAFYVASTGKAFTAALDIAPKTWAGDRYRVGTTSTELNGFFAVEVPKDALDRGLFVTTEFINTAKTGDAQVGLVPVLNTGLLSDPDGRHALYSDPTKAGVWASTTLPANGGVLVKGEASINVPALPANWTFTASNGAVYNRSHVVGARLAFRSAAGVAASSLAFVTLRADYAGTGIGAYFDGDTLDTSTTDYLWSTGTVPGISEARSLTVVAPDPPEPPVTEEPSEPPEPEVPVIPEPVDPEATHPLARRLVAYVGRPGDTEALALANAQLPIVEAFVHGYTRGRGFYHDGSAMPPIQAVIISAAARLLSNPEQVTWYQIGDYSERPRVLEGYTLAEIGVLHRYRKRAA